MRMASRSRRAAAAERPIGAMSKVVGLYQMLLRRNLEHFFPDATLESAGDRSFIGLNDRHDRTHFRIADDPDGLGIEIEWFRTRYLLLPGSPSPFLDSEKRLVGAIARMLDRRFRSLFEPEVSQREEIFHFATEDVIVAEYLDATEPIRIPAALEVLRVAAL